MASSPSASPSVDNHRNKLQDTMSKALDKVMANSEQSYNDFVDSFTFLKNDEVVPTMHKQPAGSSQHAFLKKDAKARTNVKLTESRVSEGSKMDTDQSSGDSQCSKHQEELETEVLAEGSVSSRLSQSKMVRTGATVKVDNFVEEEEDDGIETEELEEICTEGYMASFTPSSGQSQSRTAQSTNQPRDMEANDITDMFAGQLSLDENSTDKLLLNFLADLQNESNEQIPVRKPEQTDTGTSLDIQQFLDKKKDEKEEVTFSDDDDDEAASNIADNSDKGNVKVVVKPEELVDIENVKKKMLTIDLIDDEKQLDSEGVRVVGEPRKENVEEPVEAPKDLLFPGEAETRDDQPGTSHESLLDFKATYREPAGHAEEGSNQVECSDSVEPFSLDADFDYDNVVLTPKFSQIDIKKMATLISQPS